MEYYTDVWGGVKNTLRKLFYSANQKKIEKLALDMNEKVIAPVYDKLDIGSDKTIKLAFIGNSITLHKPSASIGWSHSSGMAASKLENDYVHRTVERISRNKTVNVEYAVINISDWERNFESFNFARITHINEFEPDYTIFQLGENVLQSDVEEKRESFIQKYIELVEYVVTNQDEIICLPFWYSEEKNHAITKVALETKCYLVDLSPLGNGLDKKNYANSEIKYKHPGVAVHPGDFGMENISDKIFSVLNVVIE